MTTLALLHRELSRAEFGDSPSMLDRDSLSYVLWNTLERSTALVFLIEDCDGTLSIVDANYPAQQATGYSRQQLVGRPLLWLFEDEAEPSAITGLLAAARAATSHQTQLRCRTLSGGSFWFGLHLMPTSETDRRRFVVLGHDVTAALRDQERGQAIQGLLAKVFVTVDAPVYILDLQGRVLMSNPAFERLLEVPSGSLIGVDIMDYYAPAHHEALAAARAQQNSDGLEYSLTATLLLGPAGKELPCRLTVVMVQRPDLLRFRIVTIRPSCAAAAAPTPATRTVMAAGRIQLIGLEEVRQTLGPRWAALKERAMATAEKVLRRSIGPLDTYSVTHDGGFVVCFASATEEEAGFRAAGIGKEIRRTLIGEGESPEVAHVFSTATTLPPGSGELPPAEIAKLVQDRIGQRLRAIQESARAALVEALATSSYEREAVHARDRAEPLGWCVRLDTKTKRAMDVAVGALPRAETETLDQDLMLLGFAQECAVEHALHSPNRLVFVTLSPDVLLVRKRMEACLEACRAIGERIRKQLVLVVTIPSETASRRLASELPRLRSFCRFLGVASDTLGTGELDIRGLSVAFMLVDASASDVGTRLKARADSLHAQRCRLLMFGANRQSATRLFTYGADFVSISEEAAAHA